MMERTILLLSVVAVGICAGVEAYDTYANEFFTGFPKNRLFPVLTTPRLYITTQEAEPVNFTVRTEVGFSFDGVATPGSVTTVEIADDDDDEELKNLVTVSSGTELHKAFHIKAQGESTIAVHASNYARGSVDAFAVLPMHVYDIPEYIYYAISTGNSAGTSVGTTLLVSGANDTRVTIFPTTNISLPSILTGLNSNVILQPGQNYTITLEYMQTFLVESMAGEADMSGTKFVSSKPLSVVTGHQCGNVPISENYCDHIAQQVPPTAAWGRTYMALPFAKRTTGAVFKIVASEDLTVNITCGNTSEVGASEHSTLEMTQDQVTTLSTNSSIWCSFAASSAILVTQLSMGGQGEGFGDPLSLRIVPLEQYVHKEEENMVVVVPPSPFIDAEDDVISETIVSIFVDSYTDANITLDDAEITDSQWIPIYSRSNLIGYGAVVTDISTSSHTVTATNGASLAVLTYGFSSIHDAFGYPVSGDLDLINFARYAQFSTINHTITEGENYHIPVQRTNRLSEELSMEVKLCDGTALPDTVAIDGQVTFESGASQASVLFTVEDDKEPQALQCYCVELVQPRGLYMYLEQPKATVCVRDNEGVSLNLLGVEVLEGTDDRQLEIKVSTEGYEGEEGVVIYVEPVIKSNAIDKRDIHIRQVMNTPPIAITITKYLKQSLYSVPLNPNLVITENDFIVIEAQDNEGVTIPDTPVQILPSIPPTRSSSTIVPSSTGVTIATVTMATSPSPTSVTTAPFLLSFENWNLVLVAVVAAILFVLMLTCLVCSCLVLRYRRSNLVNQSNKPNDLESGSFNNTTISTKTSQNTFASSVNDLSMKEKQDDPYLDLERPQSAIVTSKISLTSDDSSPPNSAYNSMDVLVEQSAREMSKL